MKELKRINFYFFQDLFPYANIGWGPNKCWPYSYEAFVIAARYFPGFGTSSPNTVYTKEQNTRRDLAAFFAQALQETGANDASLYGCITNLFKESNCLKFLLFKFERLFPKLQFSMVPRTPQFPLKTTMKECFAPTSSEETNSPEMYREMKDLHSEGK